MISLIGTESERSLECGSASLDDHIIDFEINVSQGSWKLRIASHKVPDFILMEILDDGVGSLIASGGRHLSGWIYVVLATDCSLVILSY